MILYMTTLIAELRRILRRTTQKQIKPNHFDSAFYILICHINDFILKLFFYTPSLLLLLLNSKL